MAGVLCCELCWRIDGCCLLSVDVDVVVVAGETSSLYMYVITKSVRYTLNLKVFIHVSDSHEPLDHLNNHPKMPRAGVRDQILTLQVWRSCKSETSLSRDFMVYMKPNQSMRQLLVIYVPGDC